ncbi:BTAD domain-containing putative transcriptional regulator [Nocardioides sp. SYSU D00065]|uniref:BTAD domain-containing putative transcriptional regulator n=1 Tax=Nocardioides sp. SYSU D00065 TaxID=2817378 RepID=UPI001B32F548|nr:BTAD domain-containing putative transcriptional regulator [Nocardioides sp. SYSU D00065]
MIEVLGPLQVSSDGEVVDVGSPRHREVLAALVVDCGRVVSSDSLLERVWGDVGRGASPSNLHAVISRLRGRLAAAGLGVGISTVSPGYRLDADGAVDAVRFQELLDGGREAHASGDLGKAQLLLEESLGLWRGPAYADIRLPFAEVESARLEGQRLAACELLVDVDLALGRLDAALDRLPALVAEHPLREAFRRQQMLALYRSGRQAEALAVYADLRELLADELGIDPGPQLQELHHQVLTQDSGLDAPPAPPVTPPAAGPARAAEPLWHSDVVVPADGLVGRQHDVEHLSELLAGSGQRLVTVTGIGGVGKTRLAHAVAEASRGAFADGVVVVSLAPVTDPDLVLPAIGRAAGLAAVEGLDPLEAVVAQLRSRHLLVVVDNLEHLLDAAPALARLVASCPRLSLLVTSRTTLRVRGELQYQLPPLELPAEDETDPDVLGASAAVALFVDRARGVQPGLVLDGTTATAVAGICRRLAGIPLAIELAAARSHLMPPALILEHLDRVMAQAGARDLPVRQRTMRAALDWSHQLLGPEQQAVLRRLAVFSGGFTLDAVEAVLGEDPNRPDALAVLEELVAHSLVLRDADHPDVLRFRLLEPVAQFVGDLLVGEERRAAQDAHLRHFLALAEATEPSFRGPGTAEALALTQREHANLVAAAEWALTSGQGDLAGRLTWAIWLFWWLRGHFLEGRRLTQGVVEQDVSGPVAVRAHAVLGALTFAQGDMRLARNFCRAAELGREIGDLEGEAHGVAGEGLIALAEGSVDEAEVRFVEAVRLTEACGLGGEWLWTLAHVWRATVRLLVGFPDQAEPLLTAALAAARRRNDPLATYVALFTSVQVATASGDVVRARAQIDEGVSLSVETGDMANLAYFLEALAVVESQQGAHARVAALHGAAERLRETVGADVYGYYQPDERLLADALAAARDGLAASYDDEVARGRALGLAEVVALARSGAAS